MKLYYFANVCLPSQRAHGIQIVKMCEAFADGGLEVELIIPKGGKGDIFEFYSIKKNFKIKKIMALNLFRYNFKNYFALYFQALCFSLSALFYILFSRKKMSQSDIFYFRGVFAPAFPILIKKNIFLEAHDFNKRLKYYYKFILPKLNGLILITKASRDEFLNSGTEEKQILVAPDGVDFDMFDVNISKDEAREKLSLPIGKKLIFYIGHLYRWKGVQVLVEAAKMFDNNTLAVFVGGTENDIKDFTVTNKDNKNVLILGSKPYNQIPLYLKAADVLVLPNVQGTAISEKYTSPMKLFEYMSSKRPIVASSLPSILEILNNSNSILVEPAKPEALKNAIERLVKDEDLADNISAQAYEYAKKYSWIKRAEKIKEFILLNK